MFSPVDNHLKIPDDKNKKQKTKSIKKHKKYAKIRLFISILQHKQAV